MCVPLHCCLPLAPLQMVIACWCQREAGVYGAPPLSSQEQEELNFLYAEWAHPFFISIQEFCRLMEVRGLLKGLRGKWVLGPADKAVMVAVASACPAAVYQQGVRLAYTC